VPPLDGPVVIDLAEIVADSAIAPANGKADHLPLDGAIDRAVCAFVAFAYQPVLRRAAKRRALLPEHEADNVSIALPHAPLQTGRLIADVLLRSMAGMGAAKHLHVAAGLGHLFIYFLPIGRIRFGVWDIAGKR
jgi:hypothetical protein